MISTHESHVYVAQATIPDLPWPARILASRRQASGAARSAPGRPSEYPGSPPVR